MRNNLDLLPWRKNEKFVGIVGKMVSSRVSNKINLTVIEYQKLGGRLIKKLHRMFSNEVLLKINNE